VLLATVTSLPELITSISSVTLHSLPDMAVGGLLGSCMFNMMVIAFLDLFSRKAPVSNLVHQGHMIAAGFGIVLTGFVAIDILFSKYLPVLEILNRIDIMSLTYVPIYLIAMKLIYAYEKRSVTQYVEQSDVEDGDKNESLARSSIMFAVYSIVIVAAACWLPAIGDEIGKLTGWGESFIGSSFIAIATSLPEITVSFSAARRGSFDMAVANLLGSNLFNLAILAITDFCYLKGPLLRDVSVGNTLAALTAMISMAIVIIGLTYRAEKKVMFLAGDAVGVMLVYVLANFLLFKLH
ncbi:MAG TPA: hypothetical protein V6C72_17545, partial [Chroococcales cyanobacterium]